jgi:hypothetical protein
MKKEQKKGLDASIHKAVILKALAHPIRIRLFEALADGRKPSANSSR